MVEITRPLKVDGVVWDIRADWRALEGLETDFLSVTNTTTKKTFHPRSVTFKYIVAEVKIAGLMESLTETEAKLETTEKRAPTSEENFRIIVRRRSDILTRSEMPWRLNEHPIYTGVTNQELLARWGITLGKTHEDATSVDGTIPETWSVAIRGGSWLKYLPKACLQDEKGQVRGYFDPNWIGELTLVPAVKLVPWSNDEGCDGIDVFFLDRKKAEWGAWHYHRDTASKQQTSLNALAYADQHFPLRHNPTAYW